MKSAVVGPSHKEFIRMWAKVGAEFGESWSCLAGPFVFEGAVFFGGIEIYFHSFAGREARERRNLNGAA